MDKIIIGLIIGLCMGMVFGWMLRGLTLKMDTDMCTNYLTDRGYTVHLRMNEHKE